MSRKTNSLAASNQRDVKSRPESSNHRPSEGEVTSKKVATAEQLRMAQLYDRKEDTEIKQKVQKVMEMTSCSEEMSLNSLHDCHYDVEQAINNIFEKSAGVENGEVHEELAPTAPKDWMMSSGGKRSSKRLSQGVSPVPPIEREAPGSRRRGRGGGMGGGQFRSSSGRQEADSRDSENGVSHEIPRDRGFRGGKRGGGWRSEGGRGGGRVYTSRTVPPASADEVAPCGESDDWPCDSGPATTVQAVPPGPLGDWKSKLFGEPKVPTPQIEPVVEQVDPPAADDDWGDEDAEWTGEPLVITNSTVEVVPQEIEHTEPAPVESDVTDVKPAPSQTEAAQQTVEEEKVVQFAASLDEVKSTAPTVSSIIPDLPVQFVGEVAHLSHQLANLQSTFGDIDHDIVLSLFSTPAAPAEEAPSPVPSPAPASPEPFVEPPQEEPQHLVQQQQQQIEREPTPELPTMMKSPGIFPDQDQQQSSYSAQDSYHSYQGHSYTSPIKPPSTANTPNKMTHLGASMSPVQQQPQQSADTAREMNRTRSLPVADQQQAMNELGSSVSSQPSKGFGSMRQQHTVDHQPPTHYSRNGNSNSATNNNNTRQQMQTTNPDFNGMPFMNHMGFPNAGLPLGMGMNEQLLQTYQPQHMDAGAQGAHRNKMPGNSTLDSQAAAYLFWQQYFTAAMQNQMYPPYMANNSFMPQVTQNANQPSPPAATSMHSQAYSNMKHMPYAFGSNFAQPSHQSNFEDPMDNNMTKFASSGSKSNYTGSKTTGSSYSSSSHQTDSMKCPSNGASSAASGTSQQTSGGGNGGSFHHQSYYNPATPYMGGNSGSGAAPPHPHMLHQMMHPVMSPQIAAHNPQSLGMPLNMVGHSGHH